MEEGGKAPDNKGQPGLIPAALYGLCPACGARSLFGRYPDWGILASQCSHCGFGIARHKGRPILMLPLTFGVFLVMMVSAFTIDALVSLPDLVLFAIFGVGTFAAVTFTVRAYQTSMLYSAYRRELARSAQDEPGSDADHKS